MKRLFFIVTLTLGLIAVTSCDAEKKKLEIVRNIVTPESNGLPNFAVRLNDGTYVNRMDLLGCVSVLGTFSVGDSNSQKMLSLCDDLQGKYINSVRFVMINDGDGSELLETFWRQMGFTLPYSPQDNDRVARKFSDSVPYLAVMSDEINIVNQWTGKSMPNRETLDKILDELTK